VRGRLNKDGGGVRAKVWETKIVFLNASVEMVCGTMRARRRGIWKVTEFEGELTVG